MGGPIACDAAADHTRGARARIVDTTQLCNYPMVKLHVVQCLKHRPPTILAYFGFVALRGVYSSRSDSVVDDALQVHSCIPVNP